MGHGHGVAAGSGGARHLGRLWVAFAVGAVFMLVEGAVGIATGSLALISDAAHMLTDVLGVGMALAAILLASRAGTGGSRTFGLYRAEVLAALANAVLLFGVAGYVVYEAVGRFGNPPEVPGLPVLLAAAAGLVAQGGHRVRAARHVVGGAEPAGQGALVRDHVHGDDLRRAGRAGGEQG
ncbi:cation diffusion facilitator family transporter, partial [Saccharothrix sp. MB29]|nr:cation diffusion facilitator family transporter [Saccharothrix sp. MB29]